MHFRSYNKGIWGGLTNISNSEDSFLFFFFQQINRKLTEYSGIWMKVKKEIESSHDFLHPLAYIQESFCHHYFFLPCIVLFNWLLWVLSVSDCVYRSMITNWKVSTLPSIFSQSDSAFLLCFGSCNFVISSLFIVKKY